LLLTSARTNSISPDTRSIDRREPFITTFWQLSLGELEVPEKTYAEIITRLNGMASQLNDWSQPNVALNRFWIEAYRSNREHILRRVDALNKEMAVQRTHHEASKKRLEVEMKTWFTGGLGLRGP
jgi:hypothetical protein